MVFPLCIKMIVKIDAVLVNRVRRSLSAKDVEKSGVHQPNTSLLSGAAQASASAILLDRHQKYYGVTAIGRTGALSSRPFGPVHPLPGWYAFLACLDRAPQIIGRCPERRIPGRGYYEVQHIFARIHPSRARLITKNRPTCFGRFRYWLPIYPACPPTSDHMRLMDLRRLEFNPYAVYRIPIRKSIAYLQYF